MRWRRWWPRADALLMRAVRVMRAVRFMRGPGVVERANKASGRPDSPRSVHFRTEIGPVPHRDRSNSASKSVHFRTEIGPGWGTPSLTPPGRKSEHHINRATARDAPQERFRQSADSATSMPVRLARSFDQDGYTRRLRLGVRLPQRRKTFSSHFPELSCISSIFVANGSSTPIRTNGGQLT